MNEDKYFLDDCPKCGNNNHSGKIISKVTPSIYQDKERKEYFHCHKCDSKFYVKTMQEIGR